MLLLSACGGGGSSRDVVTNLPPVISAIDDQAGDVNNVLSVAFTISDDATPAGSLSVSATFDNDALLSDVTIAGDGTNRTLEVTPAPGEVGSAVVTISVADSGGVTSSASFNVSFNLIVTSFGDFTREVFAEDANSTPREINDRSFTFDADSFDDLLD